MYPFHDLQQTGELASGNRITVSGQYETKITKPKKMRNVYLEVTPHGWLSVLGSEHVCGVRTSCFHLTRSFIQSKRESVCLLLCSSRNKPEDTQRGLAVDQNAASLAAEVTLGAFTPGLWCDKGD